jgi:hypothetical protein
MLFFISGKVNQKKGLIYWSYGSLPEVGSLQLSTMGGSYPVVLQGEGSSGGKVGIGFSDPEGLLHVGKISSTYTGIFGVNVSNYNTGTNVTIGDNSTSAYLFIGQDVNHKGFLGWNYNATPALSYFTIGSYSGSHPLILQGSGGGVGIGTTNPVGKLEVITMRIQKFISGILLLTPVYFTNLKNRKVVTVKLSFWDIATETLPTQGLTMPTTPSIQGSWDIPIGVIFTRLELRDTTIMI